MEGGGFFNPEGEESRVEFDLIEPTPEKIKIKPELRIIVPPDFKLREEDLGTAITAIVNEHQRGDSIEELRAKEIEYTGKRIYPTPIYIKAEAIVGTENKNGWAGLVEGIGKTDQDIKTQSLKTVFKHAQQLIEADQDERNKTINGVELAMYGGKFFVDSDGRHRVLTLKALAKLGCDVTLSGMKVSSLE